MELKDNRIKIEPKLKVIRTIKLEKPKKPKVFQILKNGVAHGSTSINRREIYAYLKILKHLTTNDVYEMTVVK
ncbi:MAG: hypothetical protein ACPGXZ_00725 [Saprospiraceae bacterium]